MNTLDRLFDDFWTLSRGVPSQWNPACEVEETRDHYLLSLDMPGVSKEDIRLEVMDNRIMVAGERRREHRSEDHWHSYTERGYGEFQRAFTLPAGVDPEHVEAHYADGVLTISVPKAESAKPRRIKIGTGTGALGKLLGQSKDKQTAHEKVA